MHLSGMNQSPAIPEAIRVVAFDVKTFPSIVLKNRDRVVASFDEQIDRLRPQQRCVEPVKQYGPAAPLSVANLPGKDGFFCGVATTIQLKVSVSQPLDQLRPQSFGSATECHVTRGIDGFGPGAELTAVFINNSLPADNDDVLLKIVEILHALDQQIDVQGILGQQNDIGLPVGCTQRDITG